MALRRKPRMEDLAGVCYDDELKRKRVEGEVRSPTKGGRPRRMKETDGQH